MGCLDIIDQLVITGTSSAVECTLWEREVQGSTPWSPTAMGNCFFCKIIKGEIPAFKVWEDDHYLAFLDINPIKDGHTMIIPKKHEGYFFDLEDQELHGLISGAKIVAEILKQAFQPRSGKVGVMVYGLDIDHVHLHLVPIDKPGDLSFANKKPASPGQLQTTLAKIKKVLKV